MVRAPPHVIGVKAAPLHFASAKAGGNPRRQ
jgi:hypothetical protein